MDDNTPYFKGTNYEDGLSDFYFLIYTANPTKDTVKVWVDGDKLKMVMKRDKFYNIIEKLVDFKTSQVVHGTCTTYGCFYQLDRFNKSIMKLHPSSDSVHLNPAADFKRAHEKLENDAHDLGSQYQESISDWMNKGIENTPFIGNKNKGDEKENRLK